MLSRVVHNRIRIHGISTWISKFASSTAEQRRTIIEGELLIKDPATIGLDLTRSVGGINAAIQLRNELQKSSVTGVNSSQLDDVVQSWLSVVFCVDALALQQVTFDSSGSTLETIARADTVHSVRSIRALKKRLQKSRRCYALFHSALPNFPLAFIHVALTNDLANSMR
jgi:hypothetical protein